MNTITIDDFTKDSAVIKIIRVRIQQTKNLLKVNEYQISIQESEIKDRQSIIDRSKDELSVYQHDLLNYYKIQQETNQDTKAELEETQRVIDITNDHLKGFIHFKNLAANRLNELNKYKRKLENDLSEYESSLKEFEMKFYKVVNVQELIITLSTQSQKLSERIKEIVEELRTNSSLKLFRRKDLEKQRDEFTTKLRKINERVYDLRQDASFRKAVG
jgi:chromosome segregation ATPase